jgi:hypothetical protein
VAHTCGATKSKKPNIKNSSLKSFTLQTANKMRFVICHINIKISNTITLQIPAEDLLFWVEQEDAIVLNRSKN